MNKSTKQGSENQNNSVKNIQQYVAQILKEENITPFYYGKELHIREMTALDGGMVKLFQQSLLIDVAKKSQCVWDNGFFIEPKKISLTGYHIVQETPKSKAARYPLYAVLLDSINTGIRLSKKINTLELSNFPVIPVPKYMKNMEVALDWDDLIVAFSQKEAEYRADQFKTVPQSQLQ